MSAAGTRTRQRRIYPPGALPQWVLCVLSFAAGAFFAVAISNSSAVAGRAIIIIVGDTALAQQVAAALRYAAVVASSVSVAATLEAATPDGVALPIAAVEQQAAIGLDGGGHRLLSSVCVLSDTAMMTSR